MKKFRLLYYITFTVFIIAGLSFLSLVIISFFSSEITGVLQLISYIIAGVFWLCLLIGVISLIITNKSRRKLEKEMNLTKDKLPLGFGIGIFSFFRNKKSVVIDIILFISLITNVLFVILKININWAIIISMVIFVFALIFHSFLNGKNYKCLTYFKNNTTEKGDFENE